MDWLGSLIGGIFGLGSSGVNALAQQSANKTNMRIAQMNNEYNYRMFQEQQQYNREMYEKQWQDQTGFAQRMWAMNNEYNSAASQRARLEEAGLNPYLMMNGGSAGTASATSASGPGVNGVNPPTAEHVQVQPVQYDLSTAAGFLSQALELNSQQSVRDSQAAKNTAEAEQVHIENQYKAAELASNIMYNMENTKSVKAKRQYQELLTRLQNATFSSDVQIKARTADNLKTLGQLQNAKSVLTTVQTQLIKEQMRWVAPKAQAEITALLSSGELSRAQAKKSVQDIIESEARTAGIRISNEQSRAVAGHIVTKAFYDAVSSEKEAELKGQRKSFSASGNVNVGVPGVSIGAGGSYSESRY